MRQATIILLLICGLVLAGCNATGTPVSSTNPTATTAPPATDTPSGASPNTTPADTPIAPTPTADTNNTVSEPGFNLLVVAEGEIQLQRSRWSNFHATTFGTVLERGDLLNVPSGAKASVLCDNLTIWSVPPGPAPAGLTNGCPQPPEPALVRGGVTVGNTRGGDPTVPYIISPRSTKLLDATPILRWNASPGATNYLVQIRGSDFAWYQENVTTTALEYPGQPSLEPGVTYLLVVEGDNGKSSQDEGRRGLGFTLLDETEAQPIQANADRINELNLSDEAKTLALAQLYAGHDLIAKAMETLETVVADGNEQVAIHQILGDLYAHNALSLLAEQRYLEALELAGGQDNIESIATMQANLGRVYISLGNVDEAIRHLEAALTGYEALGDTETVQEIMELLEALR